MEHVKQAVQRAIEAGYRSDWMAQHDTTQLLAEYVMDSNDYLLDPLFWRALGKSLGWEKSEIRNEPLEYWMRFIFHIEAGQTPDSFFDALLNTK